MERRTKVFLFFEKVYLSKTPIKDQKRKIEWDAMQVFQGAINPN